MERSSEEPDSLIAISQLMTGDGQRLDKRGAEHNGAERDSV